MSVSGGGELLRTDMNEHLAEEYCGGNCLLPCQNFTFVWVVATGGRCAPLWGR